MESSKFGEQKSKNKKKRNDRRETKEDSEEVDYIFHIDDDEID